MKELIKSIAQALVDHPEQVEVAAIEGNHTTVLELSVADGTWERLLASRGELLMRSAQY